MITFRGDQRKLFKLAEKAGLSQLDMSKQLGIRAHVLKRYAELERELPLELFEKITVLISDANISLKKDAG